MKELDPSKAYRLFYPSVPAIVGAMEGGNVFAMPAVSIVSLSNAPPLVGVAISPEHATHGAAVAAASFSISWLGAERTAAVEALGSTRAEGGDKLALVGLKHRPGSVLDVPIIEDAYAVLECALASRHTFGDHELLVGRVERAAADEEDFQGYWSFRKYRPILYTGSPSSRLTTYG